MSARSNILACRSRGQRHKRRIKTNPGIKQKQIVEKLNKQKQNVSRDIIKLLKNDYISGNPNDGYFAVTLPDYPDD